MTDANYYDVTSNNQPIGVMMRQDLRVQKVYYQSEPHWVVKDPHDLEYVQYNEQEFAILNWLDGQVSFEELLQKFERRFAPYRVSYRELTTLIREFFKKSMVVSTVAGNGLQLHDYAREKRREKLQKKFKNVLAIQWRGFDPASFMDWTFPFVGWFFSKTMVRINLCFIGFALLWLVFHYDEFLSRLPSLWSLVDGANLITLGLVVVATKALHELGHAYAHKRFGGECHEIGVMIFFFVPTLYCNTSDSWMLTDKWKRMAIGAGGVYIEMVIFAAATFLWWFSSVGVLQDVCLNLMVVCSISSVLTNGNPLMRYDGYFVLSDWLEIPNLSQKSSKELRRRFLNQGLGIESEVDPWTARFNKRVYLSYGLASFVYKTVLILTICYFLTQQFQSVGLGNLGLVIAGASLLGLILPPMKSMYEHFSQPGNAQRVNKTRTWLVVGAMALLLVAVAFVPIPFYVTGECTVEMINQQTVYVTERGRIEKIHVRSGDWVEKDQPIVQLADESLTERMLLLESELEEVNLRLDYLRTPRPENRTRSSADSTTTLEINAETIESEIAVLKKKQAALVIRATRSGYIFGISAGERRAETQDENLNQIFGSPLDDSNLGAWMEMADEVCYIGDDQQQEVILLVEQKQGGLVETGQEVSILLDVLSNQPLQGEVAAIALKQSLAEDLPKPIFDQSQSALVTQIKSASQQKKSKTVSLKDGRTLASSTVQATVTLIDPPEEPISFASVGRAKVFVGYRTVLWRIKRSVDELFQQSF